MSRRNLVIAAVLAALAAVAALALLSPRSPDEPAAAGDEASAGVATTGTAPPKTSPAPTGAQEAGEQPGGVVAPVEARPPAPAARAAPAPSAEPAAPTSGAGSEGSGAAGSSGGTPSGAEGKAVANKEDIRAAIKALSGEFKACFEQGLRSAPDLDGTVKVAFTLARSPDGGAYAREGEIDDSTLDAPLVEACILSKIQAAKFKDLKGDGEVRVRYPFRLSGDGAAGFGGQ